MVRRMFLLSLRRILGCVRIFFLLLTLWVVFLVRLLLTVQLGCFGTRGISWAAL